MHLARAISIVIAWGLILSLFQAPELWANTKWSYYRVKKGDNLTLISKKLGVSVYEIVNTNSLKSANHIYAGQRLKIKTFSSKKASSGRRGSKVRKLKDARSLHLKKPVSGWRVEMGYRPRGDVRHYGLLCRIPARASVFPAHKGKVSKVGHMRGYGKYILIDHGSGWHSMYSNLRQIYVKPGQNVSLKDSIGVVKNDKLFFLLAYRGKPVNPTGYFR